MDVNHVVIMGRVRKFWQSKINGKQVYFVLIHTVFSSKNGKEMHDIFRVRLRRDWMVNLFKEVPIGDKVFISGRMQSSLKRIEQGGKIYNFNDTTIIPHFISVNKDAYDSKGDYFDYIRNFSSKEDEAKRLPKKDMFKIPKD